MKKHNLKLMIKASEDSMALLKRKLRLDSQEDQKPSFCVNDSLVQPIQTKEALQAVIDAVKRLDGYYQLLKKSHVASMVEDATEWLSHPVDVDVADQVVNCLRGEGAQVFYESCAGTFDEPIWIHMEGAVQRSMLDDYFVASQQTLDEDPFGTAGGRDQYECQLWPRVNSDTPHEDDHVWCFFEEKHQTLFGLDVYLRTANAMNQWLRFVKNADATLVIKGIRSVHYGDYVVRQSLKKTFRMTFGIDQTEEGARYV